MDDCRKNHSIFQPPSAQWSTADYFLSYDVWSWILTVLVVNAGYSAMLDYRNKFMSYNLSKFSQDLASRRTGGPRPVVLAIVRAMDDIMVHRPPDHPIHMTIVPLRPSTHDHFFLHMCGVPRPLCAPSCGAVVVWPQRKKRLWQQEDPPRPLLFRDEVTTREVVRQPPPPPSAGSWWVGWTTVSTYPIQHLPMDMVSSPAPPFRSPKVGAMHMPGMIHLLRNEKELLRTVERLRVPRRSEDVGV